MSIDVERVSFSYGSHVVLRDLTFHIPDNTLVNVLGPNGVGKSTLFRCILCLNGNWTGSIRVNGHDLRALSVRDRAREIAYIPQSHAPVYLSLIHISPTTGETSSSGENMSCMALPMNDHSTKIRSPGSTMDTKAETRLLKNFASSLRAIVSMLPFIYASFAHAAYRSKNASSKERPPATSASVPQAAMRPSMTTPTRSHTFSTRPKMCVDRSTVLPCARSSSKKSVTVLAVSTSRPLVGSSKMMTEGSCTTDTAKETFCFMPVDRSATFVCSKPVSYTHLQQVLAGHAGLASDAGRDDHHVGVARVGVVVRAGHPHGELLDAAHMHHVERLALRQALGHVDQHDVGQVLGCDDVGRGRADVARPDDGYLRHVVSFASIFIGQYRSARLLAAPDGT